MSSVPHVIPLKSHSNAHYALSHREPREAFPHFARMDKKNMSGPREKTGSPVQSSPQRDRSGVAPVDPTAFARRAGEIIARAAASSAAFSDETIKEKAKGRQGRH
jgi:hypothetical protein